jgi:orotidine-5'-phosphate decarboxylase
MSEILAHLVFFSISDLKGTEMINRLIPALDKMDIYQASAFISGLPASVNLIKVNDLAEEEMAPTIKWLSGWWARSPNHSGAAPLRVWLDWKYKDTPDTVRARAKKAAKAGAFAITVHADGGPEMVQAAKESDLYIIAVTLLTSLTDKRVQELYNREPKDVMPILANWAFGNGGGADALVCSPKQVVTLQAWRDEFNRSDELRLIVPGTRSAGKEAHDQKQVDTPYNTVVNGADYLVVGRQVTQAANPEEELQKIAAEIAPAIARRYQNSTWTEFDGITKPAANPVTV